ncbi:IS630 family transposase [Haloglycomyces albus]|uniref:IS630 family transposase n=1 Tax=Haloglycomyces albus TaxID=526067 RepID=UPI0004A434AD|nr:IS630 family transposase [Haloglycomyces albus]
MNDSPGMDMRRLSPVAQEALRLRVMHAVVNGMDPDEATRVFCVSTDSIANWQDRYGQGGWEALRSRRPGRRPGEGTRMTASEEKALLDRLLTHTPDDVGMVGRLWTARTVAVLARELFGAIYTDRGMRTLLTRWGFSLQRPDKRAVEADCESQRVWVEQSWPLLRQRAKDEGALIFFADQVGVRSDQLYGRTWGHRGHTPVPTQTGNRFGINAMSAISMQGTMMFTAWQGSATTDVFLTFLNRLITTVKPKIHLVLDGHSVHRSKAVRDWVAARSEAIELHFLPPYSPQLNPDEMVNADLKRDLADQSITDVRRMKAPVRSFFWSVQKQSDRIKSYFHGKHVRYTLRTI